MTHDSFISDMTHLPNYLVSVHCCFILSCTFPLCSTHTHHTRSLFLPQTCMLYLISLCGPLSFLSLARPLSLSLSLSLSRTLSYSLTLEHVRSRLRIFTLPHSLSPSCSLSLSPLAHPHTDMLSPPHFPHISTHNTHIHTQRRQAQHRSVHIRGWAGMVTHIGLRALVWL